METRKGELHVYRMFTYFLWIWPDIWHLIWTEMLWPSTVSFFNSCSPDQSSWSWYLEVLSLPGTAQLIKLTQNQHLQTMLFSFPQRLKACRERMKMIKSLTYFHLNLSLELTVLFGPTDPHFWLRETLCCTQHVFSVSCNTFCQSYDF